MFYIILILFGINLVIFWIFWVDNFFLIVEKIVLIIVLVVIFLGILVFWLIWKIKVLLLNISGWWILLRKVISGLLFF